MVRRAILGATLAMLFGDSSLVRPTAAAPLDLAFYRADAVTQREGNLVIGQPKPNVVLNLVT
jgi:hypothetical protein